MPEAPEFRPRSECVAIACTLRSGSNLLCDVLRGNGFGDPREWFQLAGPVGTGRGMALAGDLLACQSAAFLAAHVASRWQAVKFDWPQFQQLRAMPAQGSALAQVLGSVARGRWIFLRRRDLAAQAVSLYAAQSTDAWLGETSAAHAMLRYDFDALWERFALLTAQQFCWSEYFRDAGITPQALVYEDLIGWSREDWIGLFQALAPDFDAARIDLTELSRPVRQVPRVTELKRAFRADLLRGRQPRSLAGLVDAISAVVDRAHSLPGSAFVPARFADDLLANPGGFLLRKLDIRSDLRPEGAFAFVEQEHFLDGIALRLDPHGTCSFAATGRRLMIQFLGHGWSGIAEIRIGEAVEQLDLFDERAGTRHYVRDLPVGFSGDIVVRPSDRRHALSEGGEVWIQRIFLLEPAAVAAMSAVADPAAAPAAMTNWRAA
jgi:LPS sulfotransferase NodH